MEVFLYKEDDFSYRESFHSQLFWLIFVMAVYYITIHVGKSAVLCCGYSEIDIIIVQFIVIYKCNTIIVIHCSLCFYLQ